MKTSPQHNPGSAGIHADNGPGGSVFLITGFVTCIVLFALVIGYSLSQLQDSQQSVRQLAYDYNQKTERIISMYNAARERTLKLYAMVGTDDTFLHDELYQAFNRDGAEFAVARLDLLDMELSNKERALLTEQARLSSLAIPLQLEVVDLMYRDEKTSAHKLLTEQAVPAQDRALQVIRQLQEYQRVAASEIATRTEVTQKKTTRLIALLSGLALLLSTVIAMYVVRRTKHAERSLNIEKELAELTLRSIGDAVITTNLDGKILMMNPNAEALTGWSASAAVNSDLNSIFHVVDEHDRMQFINPIADVLVTGQPVSSTETEVLIDRHGKEYGIEHSVAPITDLDGTILGIIIIFRDVTETRALANQLSHQATHDTLTGLVNRREFEIRLDHAFINVRADNTNYALCFIDLDQFKLINDTCGHNAGDELLRQISTVLQQHIRRSDTLARLGGDEFGVLLEACSLEKAEEIANSILKAINDFRFTWKGQTFDVGASIGVSPITGLTANISELLSAADTACYLAKDKGRNRIHIYHPDDQELEKHRGEVQWVSRINEALDENDFILYYQPIVSLNEGSSSCNHYEILLRMMNNIGDLIPPMAFIPAAERYKLMPQVDKWVIRNALLEIKHLCKNTRTSLDDCIFTINISGQSLTDSGFADFMLDEFEHRELAPSLICIEITETAAIANMSSAIDFIKKLKSAGCHFALDDFGSGLSSFSYLKNMPVDFLKIDGSFVRDICVDKTDHAFIESITQIAHVMHIKTIAEFVESGDIFNELQQIGVDYAQGFHISVPMPLSGFMENELQKNIS